LSFYEKNQNLGFLGVKGILGNKNSRRAFYETKNQQGHCMKQKINIGILGNKKSTRVF
jgi:hypothetical protein